MHLKNRKNGGLLTQGADCWIEKAAQFRKPTKITSLGLDGGCSLRAGDSGGLEGWLLPPLNPDPTHFPYCVSQLLKS